MIQVLISDMSVVSTHTPHEAPIRMWMGDDTKLGDTFMWGEKPWEVTALYGTHFSVGHECRKTDKPPRRNTTPVACRYDGSSPGTRRRPN